MHCLVMIVKNFFQKYSVLKENNGKFSPILAGIVPTGFLRLVCS